MASRQGKGGPGLRLSAIGGNRFEIEHPRCVAERELDYEEGIELWKEGDTEAARDALRFALEGCGDNLWIHVALGRMAHKEFRDPGLARGHFGYAVQLVERLLGPGFKGCLPRDRAANRPFFDAVEGLAACDRDLGRPDDAAKLQAWAARLDQGTRDRGKDSSRDLGVEPKGGLC